MTAQVASSSKPVASPGIITTAQPPQLSSTSDGSLGSNQAKAAQNRHSIAAIARDKTNAALASIKTKQSQQSLNPPSPPLPDNSDAVSQIETSKQQRGHWGFLASRPETKIERSGPHIHATDALNSPIAQASRALERRSAARGGTISPPQRQLSSSQSGQTPQQIAENKMHQTSARLLRTVEGDRPFTRDFEDLFSTLMVSLPLCPHRVRFTKIDHTFTSEEAVNNLASLKFSQSNRMPDPKDTSRIVTTTTTTTFSMIKDMARAVCQRFMNARLFESADGKMMPEFPVKNAVWRLTPKGMHVLTRFCQRNGINQRHIMDLLDSPRNAMQLVILERDGVTDKISQDDATIEVIFRRFAGQNGPNVKSSISASDSDSLSDYYNGLVGVKLARERKILDKVVQNSFTGKAAVDWLMDCCTTVSPYEVFEIAELFVLHRLIWTVVEDKVYAHQNKGAANFQPTKNAIYGFTREGQQVAGWIARDDKSTDDDKKAKAANGGREVKVSARDSNNNRLNIIVNDPALRLLFREYLRDTHCEENLAFYLEVREFTKSYDSAERAQAFRRLDPVREQLAAAYGLYNAFLAPGSPCELNIDHNLRNSLAGRMTRAVGDDDSLRKSLDEVVSLFREAQISVFKLMSSDSVPKFSKEPKYTPMLAQHNFDHAVAQANHRTATTNQPTLPERSKSTVGRER